MRLRYDELPYHFSFVAVAAGLGDDRIHAALTTCHSAIVHWLSGEISFSAVQPTFAMSTRYPEGGPRWRATPSPIPVAVKS